MQCVGEVPLLEEFYTKYKDQGVVVIGISLDEDLKLLQEMVARKGMSWPQVWDQEKTVRKLFNVKGTPSYHVIDREGKLAAKDLASFKRLSAAVEVLLKKP